MMEALKYAGLALLSAGWKPAALLGTGYAASHFGLIGKLWGMVF
jgi:hypothetical protein